MKRSFSILLTFLFISLAITAHADEKSLQPGEYKILAYSLSNGSKTYSEDNTSKSVSFHSLYISPEAMETVLNRDENRLNTPQIDINRSTYQGFAIKAAYAPTPDITFHSSIGLTDTLENKDIAYTDRVGWEVDLGLAYKIFNNFAYEVHFGYMDTGELFKESSRFTDVDDITIITNKLTMSF